jgi:hypothetical protein
MKKLFFAALFAVVAVGGAFAQQYSSEPNGEGVLFNCATNNTPTCQAEFPDGAYDLEGNPSVRITLPNLFYDPI